jgi:hypothetical protein
LAATAFDLAPDGAAPGAIYIREGEAALEPFAPPIWHRSPPKHREYMSQADQHVFNQAVFDLHTVLTNMSGKVIPVKFVKTAAEVQLPAIVLGSLGRDAPFGGTLAERTAGGKYGEGFRVFTRERAVCVLGAGKYGAAYGIYELLNRMGVDYLFPGRLGEVIPRNPTLAIPDIETEQTPSSVIRKPWATGWIKARGNEALEIARWQIRSRIQIDRSLTSEYQAGGHIWDKFRGKQYDRYYERHPDIAAVQIQPDGSTKFSRWQINSTSPHAVDMVADYIRAHFATNDYPADKDVTISVGPADGDGFSQDPQTMELRRLRRDPVTGDWDNTDLVVKFTNDLFEKLLPEFPNLKLGFFSYHTYANFPVREMPHRNLRLEIADITQSRIHGLRDAARSPSRMLYKDTLEQWAKYGTQFYFWHYDWNLADGMLPYTRIRIAGEDMPYEHGLGALGYQTESCYTTGNNAPHNYLESRLMWDISRDWRAVVREFCEKAYGKGADAMEAYYHFVADNQARSGDETGSYFGFPGRFSRRDVARMRKLIGEGERKAETEAQRLRAGLARYSVDQLDNYLAYYAAYTAFDFTGAQQAFTRMMERFQKEDARTDHTLNANRAAGLGYPKNYIKPFVEAAVKYSSKPFRIVARVPERMKFVFDMDGIGEKLAFASPLLVDDEYPELSTYTSTLSRQGGIGFRKPGAAIWYRGRVALPGIRLGQDEGIGLLLGGFDNLATVYINGIKAGGGQGFLKPAVMDVTELIDKTGRENSIIIRVERKGNSEAATGGLMYPSFFFTGPRLPPDEKDPTSEVLKIVLPGAAGN